MQLLTTVIFVAVMATALMSDVITNRIPKLVVGIGFVLALVLQVPSGLGALGAGLLGAGLALLIAVPLFALGAMGGGDAKLFIVVGAFLGPGGFFYALLTSAITGGLLAVAVAVRRGVILPVLFGCKDLFVHTLTLGRSGARPKFDDPGAITVPYGAAIALGSIAIWFLVPHGI